MLELRGGACFELDAAIPYAPLFELLAATSADTGTAAARLAGFVAEPGVK